MVSPQTSSETWKTLRMVNSQLATKLDIVGRVLAQGCFGNLNETPSEDAAQFHRRLAERWEELVCSICQLPNFDHFLLPPPISTLRTAAAEGPVVIVNSNTVVIH